ncbi:MAG: lysophospholipid acyltransferase family protein [Gammaproteobacteria bacterium]
MIRSSLFYVGYAFITILWGTLGTVFGWLMPFKERFAFIVGCWTRLSLAWLRFTCGIRWEVAGLEHLPDQPCIVFARHESTWETLFLQTVIAPQATLIKRELLWIPFFGWAFSTLRPIAIDRSDGRKALRQLIHDGGDRLRSGMWVVLFPEGTRVPSDQPVRLQPGGSALASATGFPVVVFAHDAGRYWPAHAFGKTPGTIRGAFSAPIDTAGLSTKQVQQVAASTMTDLLADLAIRRG